MTKEKSTLPETIEQDLKSNEISQILEDQISIQSTAVSYWTLFRYASRIELLGLILSSCFSIAGGAALPLLTVNLLTNDRTNTNRAIAAVRKPHFVPGRLL
jgi:hypothetical protein